MFAGGSAREKAAALRVEAAALREQAELREQEAGHWAAGADGEARVARELARVEAYGWIALHDRLVRPDESKANLDHLAIGPGGVVLIDSKNWSAGAWVHDGMLFRNGPTGPVPCRSELGHVRHDAAAVSAAAGAPVLPVLCLSGATGRVTRPVRVAGVEVVPVARLAAFLRGLPPVPGVPAQAAEQLDRAFPTACAVPPPTAVPVHVPVRPARPVQLPGLSSSARRAQRRRILAGLAGLITLVTIGPRVVESLASEAGSALVRTAPPTHAAVPPFPAPCSAITDAQVAQAVGRPVYRVQAATTDTCRWSFTRAASPYVPADVEIQTGWPVKYEAVAANGHAVANHEATWEQLLVPQLVAVPGSAQPASATTQPLAVRVTVSTAEARSAAARAVRVLADLTEAHMPTGPGATTVSATR